MPRRRNAKSEADAPGVGHNSVDDATILDFSRRIISKGEQIEEITTQRKSLVGEIRSLYKSAKGAGINIDMLQVQIKNRRREPDAVLQDTKDFLRYGNLFQMPLHQADLFDDDLPVLDPNSQEARVQAEYDAAEQGYRAGLNGWAIDSCPFHHAQDSQEHVAWTRRWHEGQAKLASGLSPNVSRARRGDALNPEDAAAA